MDSSKHRATPWHVVDNTQYLEIVVPWKDEPSIVDQYCPAVATVSYKGNDGLDGHANAAFIVRAVNSHDALVEAAKAAIAYDAAIHGCANDPAAMSSFCTAQGDDLDTLYFKWLNAARAALAAAEA
jgi:hypothetical protein